MNTYTVNFRSDSAFASHDVRAKTPQEALALAQQLYEDDPSDLWFEPYDGLPVNEIAVCDPEGNELIAWFDDDMRLRLAAPDLLKAAEKVVAHWEEGDLAEAVRELSVAIAKAKDGAA
jgi:hypothetical protein